MQCHHMCFDSPFSPLSYKVWRFVRYHHPWSTRTLSSLIKQRQQLFSTFTKALNLEMRPHYCLLQTNFQAKPKWNCPNFRAGNIEQTVCTKKTSHLPHASYFKIDWLRFLSNCSFPRKRRVEDWCLDSGETKWYTQLSLRRKLYTTPP